LLTCIQKTGSRNDKNNFICTQTNIQYNEKRTLFPLQCLDFLIKMTQALKNTTTTHVFICGIKYQGHFVNKMCFFGVMTTISMLKGNTNNNVTAGETKEVRSCVRYSTNMFSLQNKRNVVKRVVVKRWWRRDEITSTAADYITHLTSARAIVYTLYTHDTTRGLVLTLLLIRFLDIMLTSLFPHNLLFLFSVVSSSKLLENTHNEKVHKILVLFSARKYKNFMLRKEKESTAYSNTFDCIVRVYTHLCGNGFRVHRRKQTW